MNPYSGHMVRIGDDEHMKRLMTQGYLSVPMELQADAETALAGKPETHVDLRAKTPLAAWAKKKRKEKIAAKSRRINRAK
jgi:hypothetical protein